MPPKVTVSIIKGLDKGKEYVYEEKESLILGRSEKCAIRFPEKTVSRYHCLLDIAPPHIMVRDFGSKNGTALNGKVIGVRPKGMTADEAQRQRFNEFDVPNGSELTLGPSCAIRFTTRTPIHCSLCGEEIEGMYLEEAVGKKSGDAVCAVCQKRVKEEEEAQKKRAEAKKARAEQLVREAARQQEAQKPRAHVCSICGAKLSPNADGPNICPNCKQDPQKLVECLLRRAEEGNADAAALRGYEQIELLGEGGMAQAWLMEERGTGRRKALKLMLPKVASDRRKRDLFLREAMIMGSLSHHNIVAQNASGGLDETFFILMEYCAGGSLDRVLKRCKYRVPIDQATDVTLQVLNGLAYAHTAEIKVALKSGRKEIAHGVVHRDFKPGNIFIDDNGKKAVYKVADFGLAKAFETAGLTMHTMTGQCCGTFLYMPRRQLLEYRRSKPDVDVFAAAATYYIMLTGMPVRDFSGNEDLAYTVLKRPVVPIRERDPRIPKKLAAVIDEALHEPPDDLCDDYRYMTAQEFIDGIGGAL